MKGFACVTMVAPGATLDAQCAAIAAAGCTGVETIIFPATPLEAWQSDLRRAATDAGLTVAAVILGELALYQPGQMGWIGEALHAIHEVGSAALITPEYRSQDPLPLFPPFPLPPAAEQEQLLVALNEIVLIVSRLNMSLLLEPITQFESRFWREVDTVLGLCRQLDHPQLGLALDFHNMNITEADINASIKRAGRWVRHVHLADNNRRLPGQGHIDFRSGLATLREIGYAGWLSFECAVAGDFAQAVRSTILALQHASG
jgi:sugar phosphate isomerase/epimerase